MAHTSTYLNFDGTTEAAFTFYKAVFGTEFVGGIMRWGDAPQSEGIPPLIDAQKQLVVNVTLPITGGHVIMGADVVESMGMTHVPGNNVSIAVSTDSRAEAERLYTALSAGGNAQMPMEDQFWGDYWGSLEDRFGIQWMVSTPATE